ncbi:MAG TPA: HAD-IA family hydrolase [Candidatus Saccharimonadales bacterium]|nr:HAD-IA family hydrolase [Candidatus Saccharimonadales bacterium]
MIKLIIFDWDDVFTLGSTKGYYKCYHEALAGVGVQLEPEEENKRIRAKWGSGHAAQLQDLLREHPQLVEKAIALYEEHFFGNTFVDCLEVVPGSQQLVANLSKSYTLAVATGGHPRVLKDRLLSKFNFPDVFAQILTIYDIDDIAHAKPHPHMVQAILKTQNILPSEAIVVGDAENDVLMARAAGVEPVVVLTGHLNRQQAEVLGVKHIIDDVTQLESVISKI